jgi:polyisoprenoid-binding protein YceI
MCITRSFRCFRLALLAVLLPFLQVAAAVATTYEISGTYAHVRFTITKWMVFQEEGGFRDISGTLLFDPQHPDSARIDVVVQAASIDTNNSTRDRVLRSDDFFDVEKFPTLEFHSTRIAPKAADQFAVTGNLTIHGVTRQIIIPVHFLGTNNLQGVGDIAGFETTFVLDRTDYRVMGNRWSGGKLSLSKDVNISIHLGGRHP